MENETNPADKMTLELYADKAIVRLAQGDTDVELHLFPKMAAALGERLCNWAKGVSTPPQPAKGEEEKA